MKEPSSEYLGSKLESFAEATNWKSYWGRQIHSYLGQRVLEVGAGIGGTTRHLCTARYTQWLALEPNVKMLAYLQTQQRERQLPPCCEVVCGTIDTLGFAAQFDTVLYIDVLEHIETDFEEVQKAAQNLTPGGYLVVLAPAHQWLYTPFDRAIGHYRRYDRKSLLRLTGEDLSCVTVKYLDSVGMIASIANKLLLRTAHPSRRQIQIWDRYMVRLSTFIDPLLDYRLGKTILVVWQRL